MSVDLPHPFGPTSARRVREWTLKRKSRNIQPPFFVAAESAAVESAAESAASYPANPASNTAIVGRSSPAPGK